VKGAPAIVAVERGDRAALAAVRALFREYADALGIDLGFQGFAAEVGDLPGAYAAPRGALLLAGPPDAPAGCVAVRPLATPGDAELKRLYVRPAHRRGGLGRRLAVAAIEAARGAGHRRLGSTRWPTWTPPAGSIARSGSSPSPPTTQTRSPAPSTSGSRCGSIAR
jgi:GNAT superfamily N-acetyltransferase